MTTHHRKRSFGPDIFELKSDAHGLIDDLVRYGRKRNGIYNELRGRLNVPYGMEHMKKMATIAQVENAIVALKVMKSQARRRHKAKIKNLPPVPAHSIPKPISPIIPVKNRRNKWMLPRAERLIALKEMKRIEKIKRFPSILRPLVSIFIK